MTGKLFCHPELSEGSLFNLFNPFNPFNHLKPLNFKLKTTYVK
jgi:hypothetical protein